MFRKVGTGFRKRSCSNKKLDHDCDHGLAGEHDRINVAAVVGFLQMGQSPNSNATLNVNTTSTVNVGTNLIVGLNAAARATVNVGGANAVINAPGFSAPFPGTGALGDPIPGGNGTVNVAAGGRLNMNSFGASIANNPDANGFVSISGANAAIVGTGTAQLVVGGAGHATLSISSGGRFDTTGASAGDGNAFFGADLAGTSVTTVNAGTLAIGGQMQVGGAGGDDGSPATVTATNGGFVQANRYRGLQTLRVRILLRSREVVVLSHGALRSTYIARS